MSKPITINDLAFSYFVRFYIFVVIYKMSAMDTETGTSDYVNLRFSIEILLYLKKIKNLYLSLSDSRSWKYCSRRITKSS